MATLTKKLSREELVAKLQTRGWDLVTGTETHAIKGGTLEEVARAIHERHKKKEQQGIIKNIENSVEVDMVQLQQLWEHLGLPQ